MNTAEVVPNNNQGDGSFQVGTTFLLIAGGEKIERGKPWPGSDGYTVTQAENGKGTRSRLSVAGLFCSLRQIVRFVCLEGV